MRCTKCDRCGREYQPPVFEAIRIEKRDIFHTSKIDLCSECMKELRSWLNNDSIKTDEELEHELKEVFGSFKVTGGR